MQKYVVSPLVPVRYRPIAAGQRSPHPHESAHAQGTYKLFKTKIVNSIRIGYITRGRSLRDLHTRGPQARGNVNHVETDSRVM